MAPRRPGRVRHSARFHPVCADPARGGAVPQPHPARRADRPRGHHRVQTAVHRLQGRPRHPGADLPFRPRMGDPHQSAVPAARLRAAVAAFREDAHSGGAAALPAARLEGRVHPAGDGVRAVVLSRQHRRGADRRGDGAYAVPRQGARRLSRRHRRRVERRRLGQRGRRHHDHHDVDHTG